MAKPIKLPKSPAACADLLHVTRLERLKLQKEIEKLSDTEKALKEFFINSLPKGTTGVAGKLARVQTDKKPVPQVEDWNKFYAHVLKTKDFSLMQRRVNETAVKERWEHKQEVPGVGRFNVVTVSCTKLK